ncbi:MAG: HemK/PrmC family methyltransferase, partial [Bacteroidota bacterium]
PDQSCRIMDIGTGSGCIPITLQKKQPRHELYAIDISEEAIEVARRNALQLGAAIHFHHIDLFDQSAWSSLPTFDVIISNPPYIPESELLVMGESVKRYEPALALYSPEDNPLLFYQAIAAFAKLKLNPGGQLFFEINEFRGAELVEHLTKVGYVNIVLEKDMQGKDRILIAGRPLD